MKFLIITHVVHSYSKNQYFAYAPYVSEMNIWLKYVDELIIVAPMVYKEPTAIESSYKHQNIDFRKVPSFNITSFRNGCIAVCKFPKIGLTIFKAMQQADHIHLRCPGNMGLLACVLQIFFPSIPKTAKYAGNWDPKAQQPWSYRLQKWILANSFLTRNIKVLVYGKWPFQSQNIVPFFTATYSEKEPQAIPKTITPNKTIHLLFVGTLVKGKNPMYAIQLLEQLKKTNPNVQLTMYGEGALKPTLEQEIEKKNLKDAVFLKGNQNQEVLKKAYQQSHFVILASKSEGWPKAIAEAMFWGCVPLVTAVSCVPNMLDNGNRGLLLQMSLNKDTAAILALINNAKEYESKSEAAINWSRKFTVERFERDIQKLLQE